MAEAARLDPMATIFDIDALPEVAAIAPPADIAALIAAETPVVIRGLVDAWPAAAIGRRSPQQLNAYLKAMDRGAPGPVMEAPARGGGRFGYGPDMREFSFTRRQARIGETLDRMERLIGQPNAPFVAIQMLPLASHLPAFAAANPMPLLPGVMPLLWIGGPVRSQTHNDRDHNLACVIAGRRRFLLFPPDQVGNLYIGPPDRPPPLSLVDPEAPDLDRFPRFRAAMAAARVARLDPGDALFLPRYWWHHVTSLDPYNAMVNYWWGGAPAGIENPNDIFQAALLAIKELPDSERAYWRAMFDAHVFRAEDDAVAHIPPDLRGPLGPMRPGQRAALKQQLLAALARSP
ncbi:cupin-like domain-containing protein [Sphingomonas fennica]|nr:cupin-like domain-containing protein [Sphingomonas fennica]